MSSPNPLVPKPGSPAKLSTDRGVYNRPLYQAMAELEEDPQQYERLFQELLESHQPSNAAERMLVEDIAWLRWQKRRNQRAQAGLMVQAREKVTRERAKRRLELDREISDASPAEVARSGLMSLPDSPSKFEKVRSLLDTLIEQVRRGDFALDAEPVLTLLYGEERGTLRATRLTNGFRRLAAEQPPAGADLLRSAQKESRIADPEGSAPAPADPESPAAPNAESEEAEYERIQLLYELLDEKQQVNQAYEWYLKEQVDVSPALLNSCFSPQGDQWRALRLQERSYDREIERKTRVIMDFRRISERKMASKRTRARRKHKKHKGLKNSAASSGKMPVSC